MSQQSQPQQALKKLKKQKKEQATVKQITSNLKDAAKAGDVAKLQEMFKDATIEQKLLKNLVRCKDITKSVLYKTICAAVKSKNEKSLDIIKELFAKDALLKAFNDKLIALPVVPGQVDRLQKLVVKNNRLDCIELLIEKTEYKNRFANLLTENTSKLVLSDDMKKVIQKNKTTLQAQNAPVASAPVKA